MIEHTCNLKTLPPLQVYSTLPPPPPSSSMKKLKTLIHTLIFSHVCRAIRYLNTATSKAISFFVRVVRESQPMQLIFYPTKKSKSKSKKRNKIFFGSFRLHYNWCSSTHVLPVPARVYEGLTSASHLSYYDSNWNSVISNEEEQCGHHQNSGESQLSGYLEWLEENKVVDEKISMPSESDANEIDKLADLFIANCHEKFMLEKVESYRRFQEMLARSA